MSKLSEIVHAAVDKTDDQWQHGIAAHDPDAYVQEMSDAIVAALVEASGGPHHLIGITAPDWTVQHPLTERFEGSLMDCKFSQIAGSMAEIIHAVEGDGRFRLWEDRGTIQWERVGE